MLEEIFAYILFLIALVIIFLIGLFADIVDFFESFAEIPERVCELDDYSVVTLGKHRFRIPSTLRGAYISGNGRPIGNIDYRHLPYNKICPTTSNSEFVRGHLSIYAPMRSDLTDTHLPFAANIILKRTSGRKDIFEDLEIGKYGDWESSGDFHTKMSGFTGIGGGGAWGVRLFVAKDEHFVTPSGNRVGFQCETGNYGFRVKACRTWFAWSDDLQVSYSFNDQQYPIEDWRMLHTQVIDYITSIELGSEPEQRNGAHRR